MAPKRKNTHTKASGTTKKQKKEGEILEIAEIKSLSTKIIDQSSYNDIVKLIEQYSQIKSILIKEENENIEAIGRHLTYKLYDVFQHLFQQGLLKLSKKHDEKKLILVKWLVNKYESFKSTLLEFLQSKLAVETSLQLDMLDVYFKLLKLEHKHLKSSEQDLFFPSASYKSLIKVLLNNEIGEIVSSGVIDNFVVLEFQTMFQKYYDLQYFFFLCLNELISDKQIDDSDKLFSVYYTIIKEPLLFVEDKKELKSLKTFIPHPPTSIFKASQFKKVFQESTLSVLSFPLKSNQYKQLLLILSKRVLPYLAQASRLMDFLTDSYNTSDLILQILALNSLYELMKKYNLEYPDFYTKLYSLLNSNLLYSRYRSRFFRMVDLFLSSTHLSSNLVASFIKRLAHLSLTGPAPGVVIIIPFIYNMLKRHPSCMVMIQNEQDLDFETDPFDNSETNPLKSNALNSSLWELEALMNHYHPNVSTLAKIFSEPFRKPHYNLEDFLDWSYKSLIESENNRKYKTMAALEYDNWEHLLGDDQESSVYLAGWTL